MQLNCTCRLSKNVKTASMLVDPYEQGKMFSLLGDGYSGHLNDDKIKNERLKTIFDIFDGFRINRHFS